MRKIEAADCAKTAICAVGSLETLRKIEAADCAKTAIFTVGSLVKMRLPTVNTTGPRVMNGRKLRAHGATCNKWQKA